MLKFVEMNSVDSLIKRPFSALSFEEKVQVKTLGRPTPDINMVQAAKGRKATGTYTRRFHSDVYAKYPWMCGCDIRNALFCFPCLLFGSNDSWSKNGIKDLGHLNEYANKHLSSKKHMGNVLDLTTLGAVNIGVQLSSAYSESLKLKKEQIGRNRYILSKIIDCIKFCGAFELALRGHDETKDSENSGIFLGLINLLASVDSAIKNHTETSSVAKWTSKTTQNELLKCMLEVCHNKIKEELKETKFVALMADETTDVSEHQQMVLVYRYEINGDIYERFWGFFEPDGQSSVQLSECLLTELNSHFKSTPNKIIAQTFDGAAVMRGITNGVQSKIREHYPLAYYVHCYAHQLNLLMEKAASQNKPARVFFSTLSGFPAFFSRSSQRMSVLEKICKCRIAAGSVTRWNFKSRTVSCVFENREALIECFLELEGSFSKDTVKEARGLRHNLEDSEFLFWLDFFHRLMPHVDILYNQLQMRKTDSIKVSHSVKNFLQIADGLRKSLDTASSEEEPHENKRQRRESNRVADAKEVCDRITVETKCRFESTSHLDVCKLLDSENFQEFSRNFPEHILDLAVTTYPMLNRNKLKSELSLIYERPEFIHGSGAVPLLKMLYSNNLVGVFDEIANLLRIIVTIPMTTAEPERCFSSLKRIKCFLRNTMKQDRLSALAMLSIEKNLVSSIEDFNTKVINLFATMKNRRADLLL